MDRMRSFSNVSCFSYERRGRNEGSWKPLSCSFILSASVFRPWIRSKLHSGVLTICKKLQIERGHVDWTFVQEIQYGGEKGQEVTWVFLALFQFPYIPSVGHATQVTQVTSFNAFMIFIINCCILGPKSTKLIWHFIKCLNMRNFLNMNNRNFKKTKFQPSEIPIQKVIVTQRISPFELCDWLYFNFFSNFLK